MSEVIQVTLCENNSNMSIQWRDDRSTHPNPTPLFQCEFTLTPSCWCRGDGEDTVQALPIPLHEEKGSRGVKPFLKSFGFDYLSYNLSKRESNRIHQVDFFTNPCSMVSPFHECVNFIFLKFLTLTHQKNSTENLLPVGIHDCSILVSICH